MIRSLVFLLLLAGAVFAESPLRVLVVTGGHEHEPSFYSIFDSAGYSARVNPHPSAFSGDFREQTDVLVLYDMVPDMRDDEKRNNLRAFLEAGKGIVVLHHAIGDYNDWPWWYQEVIGGRYLFRPEGGIPESSFKHDEHVRVNLGKQHAVTEGLTDFVIDDETYKGLWISPKVQILLTTDGGA